MRLFRSIDYLDKNVRDSIINDVKDIAVYHSRHYRGKSAGFFSIPRQVFCYVDYLGCLAFGYESGTKAAIKFIHTYFPEKYQSFAELIYSMWRHGTVHEYEPKCLFAGFPGEREMVVAVSWAASNSNRAKERKKNMTFVREKGSSRHLLLIVNICQLADDLLFSLDNFIKALKKDKKMRTVCENQLNEIGSIREYKTIQNKSIQSAIKDQLELAWQRSVAQ